jgi:hypothetical protein
VTPNIIITVASPEADAVLVNTATVSSTQPDPVPGNNSASATTTVNNCHHDLVNASRSSISASPSDVPADNTTTSRVTVTLRDACDVVIVSPPYNQQLVTLIQSAGRSDTVTLAPGFSNPTSTGIVAFDVKSGTPGTTTYTASADDVGPNPSVLIASNAPVNFYDCVVVGEQPLGNTGQTFLEFTLTNGSGMNRKLVGVTLTYPGGGNILQATLQSTGVWSGSGSSPFSIGSSGWTAGTDAARTISNGAPAQVLKLDFNFGVSGPPGTPNTYVFTTNWTDDTGGRPCSSAITVSH